MTLDAQLEAILFWKGESISIKKLAEILNKEQKEISEALSLLEVKLKDRGLTLIYKDGEVMLGTAPEASRLIEVLIKEEITKDLGKAGLETLSIILYQGPVTRGEIDYIRGVNSNFIIRNLLVRGLIERIVSEKDSRSFKYRPTFELLQYLGVSKAEDLPEYTKVRAEIEAFKVKENESN
ncbi:MAG: SMC-Scp complex subunit ScpB [Candidatus Taylorbacteria bacterium]|nr:SMC-Scp complex subunit ScpB [Candidatus Taylorbacteria bacterium]